MNLLRRLKILQLPADRFLFIGVSAPGIRANEQGRNSEDPSSYGLWSMGAAWQAGHMIHKAAQLPPVFVTQPDLYAKRGKGSVFSAGDEVIVTLDCYAHTLRLQSPTVDYTCKLEPQHQQQEWVLNLNFGRGEHQVQFVRYEDS